MRRGCGMNHERFGVADVGEVACQPECVHRFAREVVVAFDAKAQHAAVCVGAEQFLGAFVVGVILVSQIRHPRDLGVLFEPAKGTYGRRIWLLREEKGGGGSDVLCEGEGVIAMPLTA